MPIDLHMHSTASDGTDAPAALAKLAAEAGLSAIALTDHDTTAGLAECAKACKRRKLTFVPGIELSTERGKPRGALHLLGYHIREDAPALRAVIDELQEARRMRNPQIVESLQKLGVDITLDEIAAEAGEAGASGSATIGRPHIAAVLVRKGYAKSIQDAFRRYIGFGAPAYARKDNLAPQRGIEAIHEAGGVAVLAHPVQLKCEDDTELQQLVAQLVRAGLDGLEIWHSDHTPAMVDQYRRLAERYELIVTGGSDYHGLRKQIAIGSQAVPDDVLASLAASSKSA
ncbi:MAG: PHP domain-containing protein [Planctomycetes bacterium]|nr:PHP domain-containing protein [Planctomycetota bacterium]